MGGIALGYMLAKVMNLGLIWTNIVMFVIVLIFLNVGEYLHEQKKIKYSSILSMQTSISAAIIAFIFSLKIRIGIDLHAFLFGNINLFSLNDLITLAIIVFIFLLYYILNWKKILVISISPIEALTRGINANLIRHIMISFIGVVVVILVQFLGSFLITSLISIPIITSNLISKNYFDKYMNSFLLILVSMIGGYFCAVYFEMSPSAFMVIFELLTLIVVGVYAKLIQKKKA